MISFKKHIKKGIVSLLIGTTCFWTNAKSPETAYDVQMAMEICSKLPLDNVEGIWIYPDDKITVMVLNDNEGESNSFPSYSITVVDTSDARLHPGDKIGKLYATAQENVYKIELATEKNNELLLKPLSVMANLSKEGDALIIKKQKTPFKLRLNLNFNRLLPGFWKIVSTGITKSSDSASTQPPAGMVKIYPSYDGNGSSRRKVRYL